MATPTDKDPAIEALLTGITGKDRRSTIEGGKCMTCSGEAKEFKDELSRREYTISGMCQVCQDATFRMDPDDADDAEPIKGPTFLEVSHVAINSGDGLVREIAYDQAHNAYMITLAPYWRDTEDPFGHVNFVLGEDEVLELIQALNERKQVLNFPLPTTNAANDPTH